MSDEKISELEEKINVCFKEAMKARDSLKVSAYRMLKNAIKNAAIAKRVKFLNEDDILRVIEKQVKMVKESIEAFEKAGREDLLEKERVELEVLKSFLPAPLTQQEVLGLVKEAIAKVGAIGRKDVGRVMKEVMPQVRGRADGRVVNRIVMDELEAGSKGGGE
jgi:hypothetical protein